MRILIITILATFFFLMAAAQVDENQFQNTAQKLLEKDKDESLVIGGYGQIDYNQALGNGNHNNGNLDVHRLVLLFGYHFTDRLQMITEIEFEHVKEVYVEQAFLNYRLNNYMNLRGGLILIPMGRVNEYHEPPVYNGVERPNVDKYIVPTTWREIGAGISGTLPGPSLKYQAYIVNGFTGYNNGPGFNGKNGLRGGRQKGAESIISNPNFSMKLEYFGVPGLSMGLSGYFGKSQSTLYHGLDKNDTQGISIADSSVVGTAMVGMDIRYQLKGLQLMGQFIYNNLSNTLQYNQSTGSDLGSSMLGYYLEVGYDLLNGSDKGEQKLIPFIRYENYNTHASVEGNIVKNDAFNRTDITVGIGYWFTAGAAVKADYQRFTNATGTDNNQLNMGIAFMF
ncbi:hypothetical protein ACFLTU_04740 [Bacteroidota bacterium]